ncbi:MULTISPECIES: phage recombination protein Bet [unclassified Streptomyces]|uniref:phage recombination protein Bet n=1 Tax=unclassified Streptomyces TaxID=2593676 RepID=UPI0035DE1B5F
MTVTTLPTAHTSPSVTTATAGALAIRPEQTSWTPEQAAVLRQSGIKELVTSAELAGFLHLCQRTGLDPFSRQIYLIGRWSKKDGRDVYTPQTGIDGYRVIAQRVTAQSGGTYGYEDTVWCDPSGRWRDVWLATEPPAAAKVTVIRNGQRFSAVATFREYVQTFPDGNPKGLWAKMPAGQIAKCAEALALRKAFPHDLAGVYTDEEMAQADNPQMQQAAPQQADEWSTAAPRRDYLAEARAAGTVEEVREIYRAAASEFGPGTATAQEIAEIGRQLAAEGEALPEDNAEPSRIEQETAGTAPHSVADAAASGPVVDAVGQSVAAEEALRLAASRAGYQTLDADFERAHGHPIDKADPATLNAFRSMIERAAQ